VRSLDLDWSLALVALALLAVAAVSRRLAGSPVTPAMLFAGFGLVAGSAVTGGIDVAGTGSAVRSLAEATLAVVLFADASRIDLRQLRRGAAVPVRLLGAGLPLTIALGAVTAAAVFGELSFAEALILAIVLAPTDAALGQAVVVHPRVPERIRQGLNVESGLNDGICVPLLFAAVAFADVESDVSGGRGAVTLLLEEIGYGALGGAAAGLLIAVIVVQGERRDLIAGPWRQVIPAAGAALAYGIALGLHGSGFIAAFVAGVVFRGALGRDPEEQNRLTEEVGDLLSGVTFVLFGAVLLGPALSELSWQIVLYAVLSLTLARMLPVAIAMLGSGARLPTVAFLAWFGPRGLASIVFAVIVLEESQLPHERVLVLTTYVTVGLSVLLHGMSAAPLADRYARWYARHPRDRTPAMESAPARVTRPRGSAGIYRTSRTVTAAQPTSAAAATSSASERPSA
jgi:NhaP-type Na+/H+ or K+/H+ antiporter